jgi:LacI family transcriptional regulator
MPSVRDIAATAGVSAATVSRAINNHPEVRPETRERVLDAVRRLRYTPKFGVRQTSVIGLVYPGTPARPDYGDFDFTLMAGVLNGLSERRFDLKLVSIERDKLPEETYTQFFNRKGLRGVILRSSDEVRRVCLAIAEERFPHVVVADRFDEPNVNFVACDSRPSTAQAMRHLCDLGHRRIALVVHDIDDTDHRDRATIHQIVLESYGQKVDPDLVVRVVASPEGGAAAITRLLGLPQPPTAIFFTDPMATLGGLRRCHELGVHIPSELSIVGFDDSDIRWHTFPVCTSVCQDARMIGVEAARWLTRLLAGQVDGSLRTIRPTTFEINKSTAPVPSVGARVFPDGSRAA